MEGLVVERWGFRMGREMGVGKVLGGFVWGGRRLVLVDDVNIFEDGVV